MQEIWKPVKDYEELYEVSSYGRVKSLNYNHTGNEKILKPFDNGKGYLLVALCKDGKVKKFKIHRLVAIMFIENPLNKPVVNHLDCNPSNNCVDNLEWVTQLENIQYASQLKRLKSAENGKKCSKPLIAINITTGEQTYFNSKYEAARQLNLDVGNIKHVLKGRYKRIGNYTFKYIDEQQENTLF